MNDILRLTLIFILSVVSLSAFFAVLGGFFPKRLAHTRLLMVERPGRAFLLGLVNFAFSASWPLDSARSPATGTTTSSP